MADSQAAAKKILQELSKREDLGNRICNDCQNPNPQWASLSFAIFICLQCAGTHRGFGVHISFVRSISMDAWQDDQIKRMQLGGNAAFKAFIKSYPADQGGYNPTLSSYDVYHCWAAAQYRDKLDAALIQKDWSPSPPPTSFVPQAPSALSATPSTQALRKSRASTRAATGSSLRNASSSPFQESPSNQKAANESYFETLGKVNESRPDNLPPSQGGRYTGFGNTPASPTHPSYNLSSSAAPTLTELQENPLGAISKGWSLFSAAVVGATKVVSENVIQPGVEKITDPNLAASMKGYMNEAQKRAVVAGEAANQWSKQQFGVDVAESVTGVVETVKDKIAGPSRAGYDALPTENESETSALYQDMDDDHFLGDFTNYASPAQNNTPAPSFKKNDWDDDWKDF